MVQMYNYVLLLKTPVSAQHGTFLELAMHLIGDDTRPF